MSAPVFPARLRSVAFALALAAALAAAYAASLRGAFLWDDDLHITANPTVVGPLGLKEIWTSAKALYFPLVLTNFWAQHALWGTEPFGYRVVTLAFHVLAAVLLWRVLVRLRVPGAWLGAALWALHPVQVESVAWICELKNTQSAVFFLAAILAWVRWLETGRRTAYALTVLAALAAILSKPSTVMLPPVLGLCVWWLRGRVDLRSALRLVPFFALSALAAGWTIWEQKFNSGALGPEWNQSLAERFAIAGHVVWFYLGKLAWPEPLIFIYPRWELSPRDPLVYLPALAVLAGLGALLARAWRGRSRGVFFAAVFFAALLFPVLGFFNVYFFRYSFVGDHFQYLASMGPLALAGAGLAQLGARQAAVAGGLLLVALGWATERHSRTFLNNEVLWRHTLAHNPAAAMARFNLGDVLVQAGRHEEAIAMFRSALDLRPASADGWNDLGCTLVLAGRPAEAVAHLEHALRLKPDYPEPHNNLGNALRALGRHDEAIAHYRRAVALDPAYAEAMNNLGAELADAGRPAEALAEFERALALRPGDAATLDHVGVALRQLGRLDEAIARHREAIAAKPAHAAAHANLGRAFLAAGRPADALPVLERAAELSPASAAVLLDLGTALAQSGRLEAATARFEAAVRLAPELAAAHENLGTALAVAQRWPEAAERFATAVRLRPESALAQSQLAVALVNAGRVAEAVPHFEAALRLQPSAALHDQFGQVLRALGRSAEAAAQFERAARLR